MFDIILSFFSPLLLFSLNWSFLRWLLILVTLALLIILHQIYISIEGADQEKVDAVFKPMSVDLKLNDINGKNYQFSIPKLNKEISPDKCMLVVKPTKVIVTFVKAYKGNWLDLHFKEDKVRTCSFINYRFCYGKFMCINSFQCSLHASKTYHL